jgi:alpha-galactosidase
MPPTTHAAFSRRRFLKGAGEASVAAVFSNSSLVEAREAGLVKAVNNLPILSPPDIVTFYAGGNESSRVVMSRSGMTWTGAGSARGALVQIVSVQNHSTVLLESPTSSIQRIHLRWKTHLPSGTRVLGDAWERSYGDLEWLPLQAERVLPWYAMVHLEGCTSGIGVKTGAAAFAFWQVDSEGISLWLDVRNGSNGVRLGHRRLEVATIVEYVGEKKESPFAATKNLCRRMAEGTKIVGTRGTTPVDSIYGSNDWYYAYGKNTPAGILRDADLVASVTPTGGPKPFTVIDDGYQDQTRFPDMSKLAEDIRSKGVHPGLWIRPLRANPATPEKLLLPSTRWKGDSAESPPLAFDPTIPEALEAIAAVTKQACDWGYDLIKHDFTTFELFGQWGSQMGASPVRGNWHFNDQGLTNAEVVRLLYSQIRLSCGEDRIILGCNTVGHLSVGLFDASRTGDDVSGKEWERTRRTGVNTLAFRLPQHGTFFSVDADCVPLTRDLPWSMSKQWLQAVAYTGTVLLISPEPGSVGKDQREALRDAFTRCLHVEGSEPLDWMDSRTPAEWQYSKNEHSYQWILPEGEDPFPIGIQRGPA